MIRIPLQIDSHDTLQWNWITPTIFGSVKDFYCDSDTIPVKLTIAGCTFEGHTELDVASNKYKLVFFQNQPVLPLQMLTPTIGIFFTFSEFQNWPTIYYEEDMASSATTVDIQNQEGLSNTLEFKDGTCAFVNEEWT
jgi:hypothetical protein